MDVFIEIDASKPIHKIGETIIFRSRNSNNRLGLLTHVTGTLWEHEYIDEEGEVVRTEVESKIKVENETLYLEKTESSLTISADTSDLGFEIEVLKKKAESRQKGSSVRESSASAKSKLLFAGIAALLLSTTLGIFALSLWEDSVAVSFDIDPQPDALMIDGENHEISNNSVVLSHGMHQVRIEHKGYRPIESEIDVDKQHKKFQFHLEPLPGFIEINANVDEFKISSDAGIVDYKSGHPVELQKGTYHLRFDAGNDWQKIEKHIDVSGFGETQLLNLEFRRNWAWVDLQSIPDSVVIIDKATGKVIGKTPCHLKLYPGTYQWTLQADRQYEETSLEFNVKADFDLNLGIRKLNLQPVKLDLSSTPSSATIFVNGIPEKQVTPFLLRLNPNEEITVRVSKKGFSEDVFLVEGAPGDEYEYHAELKALEGEILINSDPENALVYQGIKFMGRTPLNLSLPINTYSFRLEKEGYRDVRFSTEIFSEMRVKKTFRLKRKTITPEDERDELIELANKLPDIVDLGGGFKLAKVAQQEFHMGSDTSDPNHQQNEVRQKVRLSLPVYVSLTEVTNKHYREFNPQHDSGKRDKHNLNSDDRPVVNVSWENATQFCNWLSKKHHIPQAYSSSSPGPVSATKSIQSGFRLITDAEFEALLRLDDSGDYPWGNNSIPPVRMGNYADSSSKEFTNDFLESYFDGFALTAPVASYKANSLGIHDLSGNAWEWCHDYYSPVIPVGISIPVDPLGPEIGSRHVIRGGSCLSHPGVTLRSAARKGEKGEKEDLSFRVVLPLRGLLQILENKK